VRFAFHLFWASCVAACVFVAWPAPAQEPWAIEVDFARTNGVLRPLHGINKGPLAPGGLIDVTEQQRELSIPFTRLHDCHWPNPDVVDIHAVFPDFRADPERAENYDFALTDEYLAAIRRTGAEIVYRLGESIEHTTTKRFVRPPKDPAKWAAICLGIIQHYNEGWAKGQRYGIRYWEIWNEPENRPAMWTGTDEEFLRLYATAARAIKARYPELKVGGPAFGYSGQFVKGIFQPSAFVTNFLNLCRREKLPLDFFSWHCYTADTSELVMRSKAIRTLLDANGFTRTESHLNEWNYLPGNSWKPLSKSSPPEARQRYYEEMGGAPGAAFIAAALIELQDAPLEMANLFHGELGGFGLFTEHGVPLKNYHALRAFRLLLDTPQRIEVKGEVAGRIAVAAGLNSDGSSATIVVSNFSHPSGKYRVVLKNLPLKGLTSQKLRLSDATRSLEPVEPWPDSAVPNSITMELKAPAIGLLELSFAGKR